MLFHSGSSANSEQPEEVEVRLQGLVEVSGPVKGRTFLLSGSSALAKGLYHTHPIPYCSFTRCVLRARMTAANRVAKGRSQTCLHACRTAAIDVIAPTMMLSRDTGPSMVFACQSHRDTGLDIGKRRR